MSLLAVLGILFVWCVIGLKEKFEPKLPPIDSKDITEHCWKILSLPDVKSRRRYLKYLARNKKTKWGNNMNRIDSIKAASLKRRTIVEKINGNIKYCILQPVIENTKPYIVRQYGFSNDEWRQTKSKYFDSLNDAESYIDQQIKQHKGN